MGKFSIRRIITMIILMAAFLLGVIIGATALTQGIGDKTIASSFSKKALDALPNNTYKATWFIAYYGGSVSIVAGIFAGLLFIVGIFLTFIKGKSFGWIMLALGIILLLVALITGFLSHVAAKELIDPAWLIKHPPFAKVGK